MKKGDSLERIARKYGVSTAALAALNDLPLKKALYVNRRLKIPAAVDDEAVPTTKKSREERTATSGKAKKVKITQEEGTKASFVMYKVRRGDSLERIARKHGVTIATLAELNDLPLKKPLYVDRRLKIPVAAVEAGSVTKKKSREEKTAAAGKGKTVKIIQEEEEKASFVMYTVKKGDSLSYIAQKNRLSLGSLLKLNEMKQGNDLFAGQKIKLPARESASPKKFYVVKRGDTLESIARRHQTTISALKLLNRTKRLAPLYAAQKIEIPPRE